MHRSQLVDLAAEMAKAKLGDPRRSARVSRIVDAVSSAPEKSFPSLLDASELEGLYRFVGNENFESAAVLEPHIVATVERCVKARSVVIAHDTTEFNFGKGKREGLGRLTYGECQGFFGHFALALRADGSRQPLGVLGFEPMFRTERRKKLKSRSVEARDPNNERLRWRRVVKQVAQRLPEDVRAVHVMDREADGYGLLAEMVRRGNSFVVRCGRDRNLADEEEGAKLSEALARLQ